MKILLPQPTSHHHPRYKNGTGFTLLESLVVVAILAILAAVTFVAIKTTRINKKKAKAREIAAKIVQACDAYYEDFGHFPPFGEEPSETNNNQDAFFTVGGKNTIFIQTLLGESDANDAPDTRYLILDNAVDGKSGITRKRNGEANNIRDPWGNTYAIKLDTNGDGKIFIQKYNETVHANAVSYSNGPDGKSKPGTDEINDDIKSWK